MSELFDLNVNNYSLKELLNFFGVNKNDDEAHVERSCNELKKKIQSDPKLGPITKGKIHEFLNKAVDRLSHSRNTTKELLESSSNTTKKSTDDSQDDAGAPKKFMQLKNNIEEHGDNFLITRPSIQAGIIANSSTPSRSDGNVILSGAPPGVVNPIAIATIKRALNVDTRFRSNYYSTKSTDFIFNIPYKFENVTRMSMATYEMPLTYFAISQQYENNCIVFQWKDSGANFYDNHYTLLIPDGNYNASFQSGNGSSIENAINGILIDTEIVRETGLAYTVDRTSGRSIFSCNSATDASGNLFPYTPPFTSSFNMIAPTVQTYVHMISYSSITVPFTNGALVWNNSTNQTLSNELYFSTYNSTGDIIDLSNYSVSTLTITDGNVTQTFYVTSIDSGSGYWIVSVVNGLGLNIPYNIGVKATFKTYPLTSGVPNGVMTWNNYNVQSFSTILYISDQTFTGSYVDLTPFNNNNTTCTITDGTNTQTFNVSSITNSGLTSSNYWNVNVSNGVGPNVMSSSSNFNPIELKITFTKNPVHTPFTGSMRIVFNTRAGINRDPASNVENVGIGTSSQSDTRPLPSFLGWQLGYRTAIYQMDGGVDSSGNTSPGIPQSAISEGICLITGPQYVFLCIDDYNNSVNNYYATAYGSSTIAPNIIARLNIKQQINATGAYGVIAGESLSTSLTYSREYFGPVDIQRIRVTLIDDFGRVLDLNNMDWSFALMFECVYSSSMA